jgi:hypothetical protein
MLVQAGLDYVIFEAELEAQIDRVGDDQFAPFANKVLVDLAKRYGVTTSIEEYVDELTTRYYRGLGILQALDEAITADELAAVLELDLDVAWNRGTYLADFDHVRQGGDTISPVE